MAGGKLSQREGPAKLNALCPNEDLDRRKVELVSGGRASFVVLGSRGEKPSMVRWSLRR